MKKLFAGLLISLFLATLQACGDKKEEALSAQLTVEVEKQRERADREQNAREEGQKRLVAAEERADFWKTMVWVVVITGIIFTLVGIAIGSSARNKVTKARENE